MFKKIFFKKTETKHIKALDILLSELLINELPNYKKTLDISTFDGIGIGPKINGIAISRRFDSKVFKESNFEKLQSFDLEGISIWNRNLKKYVTIKLGFHLSSLSIIYTNHPNLLRNELTHFYHLLHFEN